MLKTSASVRSPWCSSSGSALCGGGDERSYSDGGAVAGNSGMYASTRMLYTLACDGKRRAFSLNCRVVACRVMRCSDDGDCRSVLPDLHVWQPDGYLWLLNTSGMTGFIAWLGIALATIASVAVTYCRDTTLTISVPFRFLPTGADLRIHSVSDITLGQNYEAFLKDTIDWGGVRQRILVSRCS